MNLDDRQAMPCAWNIPPGMTGTDYIDLLTGTPFAVRADGPLHACELTPGQVVCLSTDKNDLELFHQPDNLSFEPRRALDQRIQAKVLEIFCRCNGTVNVAAVDLAGLGDEASEYNFDLLVSTAAPGSPAEQRAYERWTHGRKVDGLVLNRIRLTDWRVQYLSQMGFPFVAKELSDDPYDYCSVEVDGQRPVIPDYALDMHTAAGRRLGRGIRHFLEEGAVVEPELAERERVYRERLLAALMGDD